MNLEDEIALWLYRFRDGRDMYGEKVNESNAVNGIIQAFRCSGNFRCTRKHVDEQAAGENK